MAKYQVGKGIDKYISQLENIASLTPQTCGKVIYDGAKVVTDAVHQAINSLPDSDCDSVQKAGLIDGLGIAHMRNQNGFYNVKVGFDGYNGKVTKKFPKGQPNMMIARAIISGTSFHPHKNDFVRKAVSSSRSMAEAAMKKRFDDEMRSQVQ